MPRVKLNTTFKHLVETTLEIIDLRNECLKKYQGRDYRPVDMESAQEEAYKLLIRQQVNDVCAFDLGHKLTIVLCVLDRIYNCNCTHDVKAVGAEFRSKFLCAYPVNHVYGLAVIYYSDTNFDSLDPLKRNEEPQGGRDTPYGW